MASSKHESLAYCGFHKIKFSYPFSMNHFVDFRRVAAKTFCSDVVSYPFVLLSNPCQGCPAFIYWRRFKNKTWTHKMVSLSISLLNAIVDTFSVSLKIIDGASEINLFRRQELFWKIHIENLCT